MTSEKCVSGTDRVAEVARLIATLADREHVEWRESQVDTREEERARALEHEGAFVRQGRVWVRIMGLVALAIERKMAPELRDPSMLKAILLKELDAEHTRFTARKAPAASLRVQRRRPGDRTAGDDDEATEVKRKQITGTVYGVEIRRLLSSLDSSAELTPDEMAAAVLARGAFDGSGGGAA